jgi:hypothetical protein
MISHKAIGEIMNIEGMAWITALKSSQIRGLVDAGALQLGLFDERNLFEFSDPAYPDERLITCRNPEVAKLRGHKRRALLEATTLELDKIRERVARGALEGAAAIGVKLGRVLDKYKGGKQFELTITDTAVKYQILEAQVSAKAALERDLRHSHRITEEADVRPPPRRCAVTKRSPKSSARSAP